MAARKTVETMEKLGQAHATATFRMKTRADQEQDRWCKVTKHVQFEVGNLVLLRAEQKYGLEPQWEGPYRILQRNVETDVYQLETFGELDDFFSLGDDDVISTAFDDHSTFDSQVIQPPDDNTPMMDHPVPMINNPTLTMDTDMLPQEESDADSAATFDVDMP
ncbi:hypothetical protein DM01DRAFT_1342321 [Hesseltinella vesiculosa]|uniref:Uncharacterized protein n=1 Tax=Hesseltinella vesiculosa TaxID=101127 RepID=A0A1X2GTH3_9FUNG|nr:hypothetical protein DM01DRAFT_1342321 [Hesseltinella vesiculosa]